MTVIALEGMHCTGKTELCRYLRQKYPQITVIPEINELVGGIPGRPPYPDSVEDLVKDNEWFINQDVYRTSLIKPNTTIFDRYFISTIAFCHAFSIQKEIRDELMNPLLKYVEEKISKKEINKDVFFIFLKQPYEILIPRIEQRSTEPFPWKNKQFFNNYLEGFNFGFRYFGIKPLDLDCQELKNDFLKKCKHLLL